MCPGDRIVLRLFILPLLVITCLVVARSSSAADDVFDQAVLLWDRGSYDSPMESLSAHYEKHGREVGASDLRSYALKAAGMYKQVKGDYWSTGQPVPGETPNVRRFFRAERYIDIYKTDSNLKLIISFGRR